MVNPSVQVEGKAHESNRPIAKAVDSSVKAMEGTSDQSSALVLGGGLALGAYEAGAYEALESADDLAVNWLAGSSIGAVNAAIIAGNPPGHRVEQLRRFWNDAAADRMPIASFWFGHLPAGIWRQAYNQASVLQTQLSGRLGLFRPRLPISTSANDVPGLYDVAPLRGRLEECVDFKRLNGGEVRLSVATTDIVTGEGHASNRST